MSPMAAGGLRDVRERLGLKVVVVNVVFGYCCMNVINNKGYHYEGSDCIRSQFWPLSINFHLPI